MFKITIAMVCVSYFTMKTAPVQITFSFRKEKKKLGIFILILLCSIIVLSSKAAMKPLKEKHEVKPFRSFDDFFISKD